MRCQVGLRWKLLARLVLAVLYELEQMLLGLNVKGPPVDLEFAYTLSAQAKLVMTAHEVYLPKPKLAVEGPGGVQASFDFRGARNDAAGQMLTVTLTNDLDGSEYV